MATSVCVPPSCIPTHLLGLWSELSAGLRAGIISQHVISVRVFRELWDGSEEDTVDFIGEGGGVMEDAPILQRLREELAPAAARELRHIANTPLRAMSIPHSSTHVPHQVVRSTPESVVSVTTSGSSGCPVPWPTAPRRKRALEGNP